MTYTANQPPDPADLQAAVNLLVDAGLDLKQITELTEESEADGVRFLALFAECQPSADILARLRPLLERLAA